MARKRSTEVSAGLVVLVAAQLMAQGCSSSITEVRRCADGFGRVLPDYYCDYPYGYYPSGYGGVYYSGHPVFIYGGSLGPRGTIIGYSTTPRNGARVVTSGGSFIGRASNGRVGGSGSFGTGASGAGRSGTSTGSGSGVSRGGFGSSSFGRFGGFGG